jgi:hypothetical protein
MRMPHPPIRVDSNVARGGGSAFGWIERDTVILDFEYDILALLPEAHLQSRARLPRQIHAS